MVTYRHSQVGTGILVFFSIISSVVLGVTGIAMGLDKTDSVPLMYIDAVALTGIIACGVIFSKMTIAVGNGKVTWQLGCGLIRREIAAFEIRSCAPIQTAGLSLGLRMNDNKTLWLVSGRDAVALYLKSGKIVALGSPDKEKLCLEISALIAQAKV